MSVLATNAGGTVPAWAAVLLAVISGGGGVVAAIYAARAARERLQAELQARSEELRKQLSHDRAMRVRDEHRTALDDAAAIGVRFRERLAATLRQVEGSEKVPAGKVKPLALDRDDLIELRATEARLTILFGAEHEATASFQAFHDAVKEGVEVVRNAGTAPIGGPTSTETGAKRRAARQALDRYLEAAGRTLKSHVD